MTDNKLLLRRTNANLHTIRSVRENEMHSDCRVFDSPRLAIEYVYDRLEYVQLKYYNDAEIHICDEFGTSKSVEQASEELERWGIVKMSLRNPNAPCNLVSFRVDPSRIV